MHGNNFDAVGSYACGNRGVCGNTIDANGLCASADDGGAATNKTRTTLMNGLCTSCRARPTPSANVLGLTSFVRATLLPRDDHCLA